MSNYYQQRRAAREFWRTFTIGCLLIIFFSMMIWDIFEPNAVDPTDGNVEACHSTYF